MIAPEGQADRADAGFYAEQGYCHVRPTEPSFLRDVDEAARAFEELIHGPIRGAVVQGYGNAAGKYRQLRYLHHQVAAFDRLMRSETVQEIVRCLFGARRMYVTHSKLSHKEAGQALSWFPHQDNAYKLLHRLPIRDGLTLVIFLEDADDRNGTIQVFPGSHKLRTLPHAVHAGGGEDGVGQLVLSELPALKPLSVVARKGDILVFGFDMIHQSPSNQSHGYRPVFLFEIKPLEGLPGDERGRPPLVINGTLSGAERCGYALRWGLRRLAAAQRRPRREPVP